MASRSYTQDGQDWSIVPLCSQVFGVSCTKRCQQGTCAKGRLIELRLHFACSQRDFLLKLGPHGLNMGSDAHVVRVFVSTYNKAEKRGFFIKEVGKGRPVNSQSKLIKIMMAIYCWAEHDPAFSNLRLLALNSSDSDDNQVDPNMQESDSESPSSPPTPRSPDAPASLPSAPVTPPAVRICPDLEMPSASTVASSALLRAWLTHSPRSRASPVASLPVATASTASPVLLSQSSSSSTPSSTRQLLASSSSSASSTTSSVLQSCASASASATLTSSAELQSLTPSSSAARWLPTSPLSQSPSFLSSSSTSKVSPALRSRRSPSSLSASASSIASPARRSPSSLSCAPDLPIVHSESSSSSATISRDPRWPASSSSSPGLSSSALHSPLYASTSSSSAVSSSARRSSSSSSSSAASHAADSAPPCHQLKSAPRRKRRRVHDEIAQAGLQQQAPVVDYMFLENFRVSLMKQ